MRTGLFGGTFNPVHNGHIAAMRSFKKYCELDRLIVMPTGTPPHKAYERKVSDSDRLKTVGLAVGSLGEVSDYEIQKGGKSYTFETLNYLKTLYPDDEFFLYTGSDMLLGFETLWKNVEGILKMCTLVTFSRTGDDDEKLKDYAEHLKEKYNAKVLVFDDNPVVISSSRIRELIASGEDVSAYVPEKVLDYINEKNLYR